MVTQVAPNLYRIPVLPARSPLKNHNAYLIRGHPESAGRHGLSAEECQTALKAGLAG